MKQMELFEDYNIENEEDLTQIVESYSQAVVWGTDWTTETITNQLNKKNIDLFPKFQRRDAWNRTQKSKFIESLMLGLPIPQIILAEKKDNKGKYLVIDGKQRLLTIKQFFSDGNDDYIPLKLKGLNILKNLNGKTFNDINEDLNLNNILDQILNQPIRTTVIKNWPNEEFLYTVFLRLNTGSIKLSPQELRQALHPGKFIDFADSFSIESEPIKEMLNIDKPDYRMRDVEMVVRYFTFKYFIKEYDGNLKKAFDNTVKKLNKIWNEKETEIKLNAENLNQAISFTISTFGKKNAFSKWDGEKFQGNFNRAIYDIMVYYFSNKEILEASKQKKDEILIGFKYICENDMEFITSLSHTTKSIQNTGKRFNTWGKKLKEILKMEFPIPQKEGSKLELK